MPSQRDPGGPCPPFWFANNTFLEHYATTRKPKMMQKGILTFHFIYLTKVTHISSTLKFLNTKSLVVKVSNTRFNIQSSHLYTQGRRERNVGPGPAQI